MDELTRFSKKANDYRQALNNCPKTRLLELYPILWYLELYIESRGKLKRNVKIVDMMSGSGFLSEHLYRLGFTDINAIEFCQEMSKDATVYVKKIRLHQLSSFDHLEGVLEQISPDIIISLASFHHLIVYSNNDIDRAASLELQKSVIEICMRTIPEHGIFIIADLIENNVLESTSEPIYGASALMANNLLKLGCHANIYKSVNGIKSLRGISSALNKKFSVKSGNLSIQWFREFVDINTSIGHKDVAISKELIDIIPNYNLFIIKYACPWLFSTIDELKEFVYLKFGFRVPICTKSSDEVLSEAKNLLGIKNDDNIFFMGWNLGLIVFSKIDPHIGIKRYRTIILGLSMVSILLLFAIALRIFFNIYMDLALSNIFTFLLTLPVGIIIGKLLE
ncbi:MAG: class I SAM-dependent methyltransferase [Magnetococcales bacterium]|nr:class I SAM-dependent methyltransferase [Magnetococcales bacterium]